MRKSKTRKQGTKAAAPDSVNNDPACDAPYEADPQAGINLHGNAADDGSHEADTQAVTGEHGNGNPDAASDVLVLRRAAMDYLARREHSFQELTRKMQLKFPDSKPEAIEAVLIALRDEKLQSDERFAESWVRHRQSRGFGYLHILADLKGRGVPGAIIDQHLFQDDDTGIDIINQLIAKRLGIEGKLEFGSSEHQKLDRFLQSRGFEPFEISRALRPRFDA